MKKFSYDLVRKGKTADETPKEKRVSNEGLW